MTCYTNAIRNLTYLKASIYQLNNKTSAAVKLRNKLLRIRVSIEIYVRIAIYYGFYLKQCGIFMK